MIKPLFILQEFAYTSFAFDTYFGFDTCFGFSSTVFCDTSLPLDIFYTTLESENGNFSFIFKIIVLMSLVPAIPHLHLMPVPGVRCPVCLEERDRVVWVIPGKNCPVCGHACGRKITKQLPFILYTILVSAIGFTMLIGIYHYAINSMVFCDTNHPLNTFSQLDARSLYIISNNSNPLEQFNIRPLANLTLGGVGLIITNIVVYTCTACYVVVIGFSITENFGKVCPTNWSLTQESLYATVQNIVINQIDDKKGQNYFPLIFVLFIFILCCNLIGMIPYSFASTSHFATTFWISFTVVLGATILGFVIHIITFFSLFVPEGCPLPLLAMLVLIEFISYLARNVSLGLRLAANVLSGHMLLNILSGFTYKMTNSGFFQFISSLVPFVFITAFSVLEVGIAFIQAQVFVVLSSGYIRDGLKLH